METFGELLNRFLRQAGISDTELARTIGVSRQTIFRWREGLTGRPNKREDILAIARKLRLTGEETTELLLSAGFRPEQVADSSRMDSSSFGIETSEVETDSYDISELRQEVKHPEKGKVGRSRKRLFVIGAEIVAVLMAIAAGLWLANSQWAGRLISGDGATGLQQNIPEGIAPASQGEFLLLVSAKGEMYGISEKLVYGISREVRSNRLENLRVEIFTESVLNVQQAKKVNEKNNSSLCIYFTDTIDGYTVQMTPWPAEVSDAALEIHNLSLDSDIRALSLIALGTVYLENNDYQYAYSLYSQAENYILDNPGIEDGLLDMVQRLRDAVPSQ